MGAVTHPSVCNWGWCRGEGEPRVSHGKARFYCLSGLVKDGGERVRGGREGWSEVRDDKRGGFRTFMWEEKPNGVNRGNICSISIQVFGTDVPVLSIGGDASITEKCITTLVI